MSSLVQQTKETTMKVAYETNDASKAKHEGTEMPLVYLFVEKCVSTRTNWLIETGTMTQIPD